MPLSDVEFLADDSNTATGVTGDAEVTGVTVDAEVVLKDERGGFGAIRWSSLTFGIVTEGFLLEEATSIIQD